MTSPVEHPITPGAERGTRMSAVSRVLLAACIAGPLTGWLHAAMIAVERLGWERFAWYSREFVWMAPIAYTLVFIAAALPLVLVALVRPSLVRLNVVAGWMGMLATFGLLLPWPQIGRIYSLVFAIGVGVQVGRWVTVAAPWWRRNARRFLAAEVVAIAAIALLQPVVRQVRERVAAAGLPDVPAGAPNVLLVILDTVRASSLSLYGFSYPTTPHLSTWAAQGTTFDWAMAPSPWTLPSHASFLTGRYPWEMTADWTVPLDDSTRLLTEAFRDRGYHTAAVVANLDYTAFDSGVQRGFAHFVDYPVSWKQLVSSASYTQTAIVQELMAARSFTDLVEAVGDIDLSIDGKHNGDERRAASVTERFLAWQKAHTDRPFFAMLNYFDAHQAYYAPPGFPRIDSPKARGYHTAIAWIDQNIDALLRDLEAQGILDETIVIVTSDHGELFNEHGLSGHANNMYRNVLHVPMVIRYPAKVPAGRRVDREVSLRDLAATVADLSGLPSSAFPGGSLRGAWEGDTTNLSPVMAQVRQSPNVSPTFPTARGDLAALFDARRHYIRNYGGGEELFEYRTDSLELTDLVADSASDLARHRSRLERLTGRK